MFFADSHVHMSSTDQTANRGLLDTLADVGVTHITLQSLPYRSVAYNLRALYWKTHFDRAEIRVYGGLHEFGPYSAVDPLEQVRTLQTLGCDGIKLLQQDVQHRKWRGFGIDDPYYEEMFAYLEEQNLPVCMHVADPEEFWDRRMMSEEAIRRGWFYGDGACCSKQQIMDEALRVAKRHPKLKISFAHLFFLSAFPDEARRVLDEYPNVVFDLTPGSEMAPNLAKQIDVWHVFFTEYRDRILFGTDCNSTKRHNDALNRDVYALMTHDASEFPRPAFDRAPIRGLALDPETVECILWKNYIREVGERKPVNLDACKSEAEKILSGLNASEHIRERFPIPHLYHGQLDDFETTKAFLRELIAGA